MGNLTKTAHREIIEDFAQVIAERKQTGTKPQRTVIDFRNDRKVGREREIYEVPVELVRFRKENGRISSDVLSYEKHNGILDEKLDKTQQLLRAFLEAKDEEKTKELKASILHDTQREPAIITADGFLINGNRRKMVLQRLFDETRKSEFENMKVVILPGKGEEGGPPTYLEIEQIENRYQLQNDGKAEYYSFDMALSIKRKMELGMTLEAQLRDDPRYVEMGEKELKEAVEKYKDEYLGPLECVDQYLGALNREALYQTISRSLGDKEGRWQAFLDYYKSVYKPLNNPKKRLEFGVTETEIGRIQDAAFKIIRKRELTDIQDVVNGSVKVHQLMRIFPKLIKNLDAKKELLKLNDVSSELDEEEKRDAQGNYIEEREQDKVWAEKHREEINRHVAKALKYQEHKEEQDTTVNLLEGALAKLNHKNMDTSGISIADVEHAMKLTQQIQAKAEKLEKELYQAEKSLEKLRKVQNKSAPQHKKK